MKILVGCLYHETNTFNPFFTNKEDFVVVEGEEVLDYLSCTTLLKNSGVDLVPSIYATGLPSGIVRKEAYAYFKNKIMTAIHNEQDLDGIWLHLHGSMIVEDIGSGELDLVKEIKKSTGDHIPIALTLDIHANIPEELHEYVNIVRAYRTVPHVDQNDTERITAKLLMECITKGHDIKPAFIKLPLIICGEKALGNSYPLNAIFEKLAEIEGIDGISTASFFLGHSWSDSINTGASIFIIPESKPFEELAHNQALILQEYIHARRDDFKFTAHALGIEDAVRTSLACEEKPVFVSDSGDNTTAGAPGGNTILLRKYISQQFMNKKVLIASIFDLEAYEVLNTHEIGQQVSVRIGKNEDANNEAVHVHGVLKAKGDLLGYLGATDNKVGEVCTVSIGNLDVVVANRGESFITINHFARAGLELGQYDVIVLKQGYLFDELSKISKLDILALTPGATYLNIRELDYQHISNSSYLI